MLHSTETKPEEQSNSQNSANDSHKPSYLTEQEKIPNTPFMLSRIDELWFITIANTKLTTGTKTKQEQIEKLTTESWNIILNLTIHVNRRLEQNDQIKRMAQLEEIRKHDRKKFETDAS